MIRTQIQITEAQAAKLRSMSAERHMPMAELIRMGIDSFLERESGMSHAVKRERAKSVAGRFSSGLVNVSLEHDKYLGEAFGES
jgi:hypothetical protein